MSLSDKMLTEVKRIVGNRSVLLALSGGVDSCVLLHLLIKAGVRVSCAHVEHGIRGESSLADCRFAERLCENCSVPLFVVHLNVPRYAKEHGLGLEEAARCLRYAYLRQVVAEQGIDVLATAHHAGDQAETVLLHILRGTSVSGLIGMKQEECGIVRPLLPFTKEEILQYARDNNITYVTDETNNDIRYTRNFIRHVLLPEMRKVNPSVVSALQRLSVTANAQSEYLLAEAEKVLDERMSGTHLSDISDLHPGLSTEVLSEYLKRCGFVQDISQNDIFRLSELFEKQTGSRVTIGKHLFEKDASGIVLVFGEKISEEIPLHIGMNDTPFGCIEITEADLSEPLSQGKNVQLLDAEKAEKLTVRSRRDADRVRPLGADYDKLLSDVFTDRKVPRGRRDSIPLIVSCGKIVWVAGVCACENAKITNKTRRVVKITLDGLKE